MSPRASVGILDRLIGPDTGAPAALSSSFERNQVALDESCIGCAMMPPHEDVDALFQQVLSNPEIALRDRVRMACALGAVMGALVLSEKVSPTCRPRSWGLSCATRLTTS